MKVKSKFYGEVDVTMEQVINFPTGLPGFEAEKEFVYLKQDESVFGCLQSCHQQEIAFIALSPFVICPDYDFEIAQEKQEALGITKLEEVLVLAIVTIPPGKPEEATVNLQAPIIINRSTRKGMQIILNESGYPLRCKVWAKESSPSVAAAK